MLQSKQRRALLLAVMVSSVACKRAPSSHEEKSAPPPPEIDVMTVAPSTVRDTGEYLGSLLSRDSVQVMPQAQGYVRAIHVRPGDTVRKGQVLVEIDAREQAAQLGSARAQRDAAKARVRLAQQTARRAQELFQRGALSAQERDIASSELRSAHAAVKTAQATITEQTVLLQYHSVRAPVPGVVGELPVRVGDAVTPSTLLATIARTGALELTVSIPPERARGLRNGAAVEVLDGKGDVVARSTVFAVAPEADPGTQLVDVKAVLDEPAGLKANELVRTRVVYGERSALEVPLLAVTRQSGQPFVMAVEEKDGQPVVERRPVTLGPLGERAYVVEKGLRQGDTIALSSIQSLRDGMHVRPRTQPRESTREIPRAARTR